MCVQGCGSKDIEVFGARQSGYYAIVAVNWNDEDAHSLTMDFVKIGAAES